MRRDAKAMVAYLAELKGAFDPCTPVGPSLAEASRGEPLLNSAGRAALLTGALSGAGPRVLARSCGRVAVIGKNRGHSEQWDRVSNGKHAVDNRTSRASRNFSICCTSAASLK